VSAIRVPLAISLTGHAAGLALLALFLSSKPLALPEPTAKGGIEVVFEPAPPQQQAMMPAPRDITPPPTETVPPPPEPQPEALPPPPEPPVAAAEPAPQAPDVPPVISEPAPPAAEAPVAVAEPLPPPPPPPLQKHAIKRQPKPDLRRQEAPEPNRAYVQSVPSQLPAAPAPVAPPQTAMAATPVPAPLPSPEPSTGYRALLSAWLEGHKRYPDGARQRGEEGRAVLRFAVDRSGRVLDFAVISSSGYPDLDHSVEEMMRGATLPPFPADMPQPRIDVSVTIRFSLRR
jgi:protein TonB